MPKTLLSPSQQCEKTLELVEAWVVSAKKIFVMMADANLSGLEGQDWFKRRDIYAEIERTLLPNSRRKNVGTYLDMLSSYARDDETPWVLGDPWIPGRARRNDRHFVAGDMVLVLLTNGTERHPVWSVTSKGHRISGYYYNTNRCDPERGFIELLPVPGELVGIQLADPGRQKYRSNLRAGMGPRPGRRV